MKLGLGQKLVEMSRVIVKSGIKNRIDKKYHFKNLIDKK